jgi:hypothetical protein
MDFPLWLNRKNLKPGMNSRRVDTSTSTPLCLVASLSLPKQGNTQQFAIQAAGFATMGFS